MRGTYRTSTGLLVVRTAAIVFRYSGHYVVSAAGAGLSKWYVTSCGCMRTAESALHITCFGQPHIVERSQRRNSAGYCGFLTDQVAIVSCISNVLVILLGSPAARIKSQSVMKSLPHLTDHPRLAASPQSHRSLSLIASTHHLPLTPV